MFSFSAEELADVEQELPPLCSEAAAASPLWARVFAGLEQLANVDNLARVGQILKRFR